MSLNTAVMFGKATDEWSTPVDFFLSLDREFDFALDAAARDENKRTAMYLGPDHPIEGCRDALAVDWAWVMGDLNRRRAVWLNPPYSRCREFIGKAQEESAKGCTVVCLVPSRTDTRWWHEHVYLGGGLYWPGVEVRFVKGRLKFGDSTNSAPFPSVVIVFRPPPASGAVDPHVSSTGNPTPREA